jgi:diaminohydroxyphosphoribosylaminopyrimidine deaminase / 5-amino-6-(5-phosphoribosylamino)uracil reductase
MEDDAAWMARALALARAGMGRVAPNPAVGCVLVRGGAAVGAARTGDGGRPHAEEGALAQAGAAARGAVAYVTLEPCAHRSCAAKLAAAGVARVVVAARDPDPRTAGRGLEILRAAGVAVAEGVGAGAAAELNAGHALRVTRGRPLVTLKLATSLDGRAALPCGASRWITGPAARARGHAERATHDAILVGVGTVLADDPALTARPPGAEPRAPVRIILDRALRTPPAARAAGPGAWVFHVKHAQNAPEAGRAAALAAAGARLLPQGTEPAAVLAALAREGLTRVLVEGGPAVATAFLAAGLWDRLLWFRAPVLLGADARAAVGPLALPDLAAAPRLALAAREALGPDLLEEYRK